MRKSALALVLSAFTAAAFGQDTARVFHLANSPAAQTMQEILTTLRTLTQAHQVSIDPAAVTLTIQGSPTQIALAEWLVPKLDIANTATNPNPQNYRVDGNSEDIVTLYKLSPALTNITLQEILTTLRTAADIQKIFMVNSSRVIALRADASHTALAGFFISELDQPQATRQVPTVQEFQMTGPANETAIVYGLIHADVPGLQEILTTLRTVLDIQKIYSVTASKLFALRGTAAEIQMVEWLIPQLDRTTPNPAQTESRMPGGKDDVVHVFYLAQPVATKTVSELLVRIRAQTQIMKAYQRTTPAALVLRGPADQIAVAGQLIASSNQPAR